MNPNQNSNGKDQKTAAPPIPAGNTAKPATPAATAAAAKDEEENTVPTVRRRFFVFHANGQKWDFKNKAEMSKFFNDTKAVVAPPKPEDVTIIQGHKVETKHKVAF